MVEQITHIEHPIDVMSLMHKAFDALSLRVEKMADQGQDGSDLGEFSGAFAFWIKQLLFHATMEDKYMTAPLTDSQPARDNETEHAELAEHGGKLVEYINVGDEAALSESVKSAMLALEEDQHRGLLEKVSEVEEVLKTELGRDRVVTRTRRHLFQLVMELRVLEFDHFENEEAFVLSLVRDQMDEHQQLEMVRHLLIDDEAENPRWVIDWVSEELVPVERALLSDLEERFTEVATG